jgi:hypothetical protein
MTDIDTTWVPEADRAEQQLPAEPETQDAGRILNPELPHDANQADVLEQAQPLPLDDDDYRSADAADQWT